MPFSEYKKPDGGDPSGTYVFLLCAMILVAFTQCFQSSKLYTLQN